MCRGVRCSAAFLILTIPAIFLSTAAAAVVQVAAAFALSAPPRCRSRPSSSSGRSPRAAAISSRMLPLSVLRAQAAEEGIVHVVDGVECRSKTIFVASANCDGDGDGGVEVTVLEATAEAQEKLVDEALAGLGENTRDAADGDMDDAADGDDLYGAVLWPSASAVASHVLSTPALRSRLPGWTVLELGCGSGLVSLALSRARDGAGRVVAADYEALPLRLLECAASDLNPVAAPREAGAATTTRLCEIETKIFDICDLNRPLPPADLVVAADVMYEPKTGRAMARRTIEALDRGSRVVIGCSPGRAGRPAFLDELQRLRPDVTADFIDALGTTATMMGASRSRRSRVGQADEKEGQKLSVLLMDLDPESCLPVAACLGACP